MDGGSLQDKIDDVLAAREEEERRRSRSNFSFKAFHHRHSSQHDDSASILDFSTLKNLARQALRGLALLHRQHRMHRDIKPANILVGTNNGQVKLADFGIAAEGDHSAEFSEFVGTLLYMSPERLKGSSSYGFAADIWSFGLTIYACVVGEPPHKSMTQFELVTTVANDPPPRLDRDKYPSDICDFVEQCLQKEPEMRPTAKKLLEHEFLKLGDQNVKDVVRRRASTKDKDGQYSAGSPASKVRVYESLYKIIIKYLFYCQSYRYHFS